jgi:hypothetical protein
VNLKVLHLSYCYNYITNIGFDSLSTTTLINLTDLYFHYCENIYDSIVIKMSEYFINLQVFSIVEKDFDDNNNDDDYDEYYDIGDEHHITDESIIAITKNCKNLNELYIQNCFHLKDIGCESIAENCLKLKYLTLYHINKITESCITKIIEKCPKLKELNIAACKNISNYFIDYLKKYIYCFIE